LNLVRTLFKVLSPLRARMRRSSAFHYGILALAVMALWCTVYGRMPGTERFRVPVEYHSDALFVLGTMQGFSEFPAPWNLHVARLNAPFGADWNDYPHSEKLLYYLGGTLAHLFDPGVAANLFLLLGFAFNAVGFFWAARRLGSPPLRAFAGSLMYTFSTYMLFRGAPHVLLVYAGHVPILFYLCRWFQRGRLHDNRARLLTGLFVAASAFLNPYYFVFVLLMLALAATRLLVNRRIRDAALPGALLVVGILTFVANQANVMLYTRQHGENASIRPRLLTEQLRWGLRLPDMFMPIEHPLKIWETFSQKNYWLPELIIENVSAFLGLVGCAGLLALVGVSLGRGMRRKSESVPSEAWIALSAYLFGAVGGGALLLGALGVTWLRASNRYSIVILCAVLLWGGRVFTLRRRPWLGRILCLAMVAFTVHESRAAWWPKDRRIAMTARVQADRAFARDLEAQLPRSTAVFQLPIMGFPESEKIVAMLDYEPFRPYLWSKNLRFSYGTHRGRPRENWQALCAHKPVPDMLGELLQKGFGAVLIHRAGYPDRGRALEAAFVAVGLGKLAGTPESDMVAYRIR
jgi:phosphoglycerol transferase